ncbi:hypothetical protein B0A54_02706 [Friedmanniomyces endolithicus]|uniref:Uncharacterized protein n=1 Tax=Friedmanniomyces endolithicus TaxID=329885 RepID=A0A4U0VDY8_9PEZI|nr:hypothetical protein B0A54_02706 [Friedmanniomyces endolithicus]
MPPRLSAWAADPDALWQRPFFDFEPSETIRWHQREPSAPINIYPESCLHGPQTPMLSGSVESPTPGHTTSIR